MTKKLVLTLAAALMLLGTLATPIAVHADGTPNPNCPTNQMCKP